jgi:hypothetical protein
MEKIKVMKSIKPKKRPGFNEWCKEFNVSGSYNIYEVPKCDLNLEYKFDKKSMKTEELGFLDKIKMLRFVPFW